MTLLLENIAGRYDIVLSGPDPEKLRSELEEHYVPNKAVFSGDSGLPLAEGKKTTQNQRCMFVLIKHVLCRLVPSAKLYSRSNRIVNLNWKK